MATAEFAVDQSNGFDVSMKAAAAMANLYVAVKLDSTVGYVALAGDGEEAYGILQEVAAAAGDHVRIRVIGMSLVQANGAFSLGDKLNSGAATGKVDTAGAGEYAVATALAAATAQSDYVGAWVHGKLCVET